MTKSRETIIERRGFIRLREPIRIIYTLAGHDKIHDITAKDISADGLRFQIKDSGLKEGEELDMRLDIPEAANPVHARGRIMWTKKLSLEDGAPIDVGVEIAGIEEDNKNTFLKFLCDLTYKLPEDAKDAKKRRA